jgi:hypothetical protein
MEMGEKMTERLNHWFMVILCMVGISAVAGAAAIGMYQVWSVPMVGFTVGILAWIVLLYYIGRIVYTCIRYR